MRNFIIGIVAIGLGLGAGAAEARSHSYGYHSRSYSYHPHYGGSPYYTNISGHRVHRPVYASHRPAGSTAHCADGTWSFSEHHRGTCSHHGGVAGW